MIDAAIQRLVRRRAGNRCEYCGLSQSAAPIASFHIEHVIAKQHGGEDDQSNLALACYHCNLHKGPNLAGIDRETGDLVALFNPRKQRWDEHFGRTGPTIVGRTLTGRVTVAVLAMNADDLRLLRSEAE